MRVRPDLNPETLRTIHTISNASARPSAVTSGLGFLHFIENVVVKMQNNVVESFKMVQLSLTIRGRRDEKLA